MPEGEDRRPDGGDEGKDDGPSPPVEGFEFEAGGSVGSVKDDDSLGLMSASQLGIDVGGALPAGQAEPILADLLRKAGEIPVDAAVAARITQR